MSPDPALEATTEPTAPPPRALPTESEIAAFIQGDDLPGIAHLFDQLPIARFDILGMQIRKEELLPQHWQLLPTVEVDEDRFDTLPEVGTLRTVYRDQDLSRARLQALRPVWVHLRGKQPSLWTVADLFVALRKIIAEGDEVDFHQLLAGVRDIWRNMTLPAGQERLGELWAVLEFVRSKTKK